MIEPLVEQDAELEAAISKECGKPESVLWLAELRRGAGGLRSTSDFPVSNVRQCARVENAISHNSRSLLSFYVWLASGCLTTAFVMTQRSAAVRRIETSSNALDELYQMDRGEGPNDLVALRKKANDLALNCTQAALVAAKGVGFAGGHDVGRWCREALFFLVWSCPQGVAQAHLCSFMS